MNHRPAIFLIWSFPVLVFAMYIYTLNHSFKTIERLSTENILMRLSENRTTRAMTNYEFPKMTEEEKNRLLEVADMTGVDPVDLYAVRRIENGGMMLEMGAKKVSTSIKKNITNPKNWQVMAGCRRMTQVAFQLINSSKELKSLYYAALAKGYNPEVIDWNVKVQSFANEVKIVGGKIQDPVPVVRPTPVPQKKSMILGRKKVAMSDHRAARGVKKPLKERR